MAAYSTGASWSFPESLPGAWQAEEVPTKPRSSHDESSRPVPESPPQDSPSGPRRRQRTYYPPRQCRICLEVVPPTFHPTEPSSLPTTFQPQPRVIYESPDGGRLLSPCKCKGSQKYVHEECLSAWRRADPLQKRNYWECPTCGYRYRLERLRWGGWLAGIPAQLGLTAAIFLLAVFALGFVADPIINLYLDPLDTLATAGGPTGSLVFEDEPVGWAEHFVKGFAGLGLLGFFKWMLSVGQIFRVMLGGRGVGTRGGAGRVQQINAMVIIIGVVTFLYAVWQGVRAWSRRTLESASERVMDVPGADDEEEEEEEGQTNE